MIAMIAAFSAIAAIAAIAAITAILWKPGLSAEPFLRNEFYFHDNKKTFSYQ